MLFGPTYHSILGPRPIKLLLLHYYMTDFTAIATESCYVVYEEVYKSLPIVVQSDDDGDMSEKDGQAIAQIAYEKAMEVVTTLLVENETLKNEIATLKLPPVPVAVPMPVPTLVVPEPSRSLNPWNVFQRLFGLDFKDSLETVSGAYQRLYPSKEAKTSYFKENVARAMALDAKKGKKAPVPAPVAPVAAAAVEVASRVTNYNVFYAAMTLGNKGQFGKGGKEIAKVWETVSDAEKLNWKEMAPHWKTMPAELKAQWVARAQLLRTVKA